VSTRVRASPGGKLSKLRPFEFLQLKFCLENEFSMYEESVVDKFKSNLLLMIFWLYIINYNS
jgi:hypothetical protein